MKAASQSTMLSHAHLLNACHLSLDRVSITGFWALTPRLYDFPFNRLFAVLLSYTFDSIWMSSWPLSSYFFPIAARNVYAMWKPPYTRLSFQIPQGISTESLGFAVDSLIKHQDTLILTKLSRHLRNIFHRCENCPPFSK